MECRVAGDRNSEEDGPGRQEDEHQRTGADYESALKWGESKPVAVTG